MVIVILHQLINSIVPFRVTSNPRLFTTVPSDSYINTQVNLIIPPTYPGKDYDLNGNHVAWWSPATLAKYKVKAKCFVDMVCVNAMRCDANI